MSKSAKTKAAKAKRKARLAEYYIANRKRIRAQQAEYYRQYCSRKTGGKVGVGYERE